MKHFSRGNIPPRGQINSIINTAQPLSRNIYFLKLQVARGHLSLVTLHHFSFCPEHSADQICIVHRNILRARKFCFWMNWYWLLYCIYCRYQNTFSIWTTIDVLSFFAWVYFPPSKYIFYFVLLLSELWKCLSGNWENYFLHLRLSPFELLYIYLFIHCFLHPLKIKTNNL